VASHFAAIANVTAEKDQKESASLSVPMEMSNDSPVAAMKCIPSTNTVESLRMLRYILEDIIAVQVKLESLLLPVWKGQSHPNFASYRAIYEQTTPLSIFHLGGCHFIQMHAAV
jgi:hypothetical protein